VNPPRSIEADLRPISLLPTLAKVFESTVGRWFLDIIFANNNALTNLELFGVDPVVVPRSQFCTNGALLSMLGDPSEPRSLILPRHSIGRIIIY